MLNSNRNLALVVGARFISRLGGTAVWIVGTLGGAAYAFDATPSQLAAMSMVNAVAAIIGSLVAGILIDRFGPRKVMVWAEIGSIPPVLWMMVAPSLPLFVVGSALFSLFGVPTWTAGASFAPFITSGRAQLERANSFIETGSSIGFVLGPSVGALIETWFGIHSVFWVMAVASAIAAVLAWLTRIEEKPVGHEHGNAWANFTAGLRIAYTTRTLRYFILLGTAVWVGFGGFQALESLIYRDVVGVGVEWLGWMNTLFGLGLVMGAALLPRLPDAIVSARGLSVMAVLAGLGSILYVGSTELGWIAPGAFAWGMAIGAMEPLLRTLVHLDSPHEYVGRIVGTLQWHRTAGELLPLAFVPTLAVSLGIQQTLIAGGVLVAIAALGSFGTARAIDRHRAVLASAQAVPESA
ncbi:MAG: MFS transporter [Coriobacteriia bacterium]|nr:MFS transporter [Coriobacteriia bacterium]